MAKGDEVFSALTWSYKRASPPFRSSSPCQGLRSNSGFIRIRAGFPKAYGVTHHAVRTQSVLASQHAHTEGRFSKRPQCAAATLRVQGADSLRPTGPVSSLDPHSPAFAVLGSLCVQIKRAANGERQAVPSRFPRFRVGYRKRGRLGCHSY